ncbi:MAG: glycosyltransferase family 39 protein [Bacteroidales bacterium]|nr:glycosyltransferase family 39 protein [Bacteroidales bacterium]MCF8334605.1 glycosyltransferase family 39 protein [Bacteroidales bacterium]
MFDKKIQAKYFYPLLIIIAYFLLSSNIGGSNIYILDEAKNSECAREMMERSDWVVPTFNYELRTDKPPLHYYFMMMGYSIFGANEFGARFFSSVFGVLTILITFFYVRKFVGYRQALLTLIILLSSLHFLLEFHLAVPDPYLIFFLTLAYFSFYDFFKYEKKSSLFIMYLAIALGTLTKGPVAIALPGLVFLIFLLLRRGKQWKLIKSYRPLLGALLVLAINVPWYYMVGLETDWEWVRGFFLEHNIDRFVDTKHGHGGFFLITPLYVFMGMLPFAVFMIQALVRNSKVLTHDDFITYSFLTAMIIIIFFTISGTKLPNYTIPAYPFIAVVTAYFLTMQANINKKWPYYLHLFLALLLPAILYAVFTFENSLSHLKPHAFWLLVLPLAGIAALVFQYKKSHQTALNSLIAGWVAASLLFFFIIYPEMDQENPVYKTYEKINLNEKKVAYYGKYNPAYIFYLKQKLPELTSPEEVEKFLDQEEAVVITAEKYMAKLKQVPHAQTLVKQKDLFEVRTTVVLVPKEK